MADVLSKQERSRTMAAVHSRGDKATELKLLNILRTYRIAGWRRHWPVAGKPDFAFPKQRLANAFAKTEREGKAEKQEVTL